MTPTEYDYEWLQQQLATALASAGAGEQITLTRTTGELLSNIVAHWLDQRPARGARYNIDADSLRTAVVAELHRLAAGQEAPSKSRWDIHRQRHLPTAQHICRSLGENWTTIASLAGLRPNRYAPGDADSAPPIDAAAAAEPAILDEYAYCADWPTVASRVEVCTVGNIRTTREYHTLR